MTETTPPKTILLVEDEALIAMHEAEILTKHGYEVITAYNAEQAVEAAANDEVDLILMDIDLGDGRMDGTEAATAILKDRDVPIVFLSSHTEAPVVEKTEGISSYGYIVKDSGERVLLASINTAFRLFEAKQKEVEHQIILSLLESMGNVTTVEEYVKSVIYIMREWSGCEAVGIRLKQGDDYPYFETSGFPPRFVELESRLCAQDEEGNIIRDGSGNPILECMCGNVILGRTDPELPFFTEHGSFFTNSTTKLLASTNEEERQARTRNRCNGEGYESVALVQLVHTGKRLGLLQFNDHRRNRFTIHTIQTLERLAVGFTNGLVHIQEMEKNQEALKESEESLQLVFEHLPAAVFLHDLDGNLVLVNRISELYTGYSREELLQMTVADIDHEAVTRRDREHIWNRLEFGDYEKIEGTHFRKDGSSYPVDINITAITYYKRPLILGIAQDVTGHKKALDEKEFLMKELNHRVKNNLAMISSLINLKESSLEERIDLSDLKHQIDAIRIVHERLHLTEQVTHIDMRDYIQDLLDTLFFSFTRIKVTIESKIDDIALSPRSAVPIGLIINELATNAMKYGLSDNSDPRFTVQFKAVDSGGTANHFVLTIANTGNPFPDTIDVENAKTLGLQLISALVQQLHGTIQLQRSPHPVFTIHIPG